LGGGVPEVAVTENVAVCPIVTDWLTGWVVMVIADDVFTVRVAEALVALPAELVTITLNVAPLSDATVAGVVYADKVAPAMSALFFCHW
jgi:hypothetical protein